MTARWLCRYPRLLGVEDFAVAGGHGVAGGVEGDWLGQGCGAGGSVGGVEPEGGYVGVGAPGGGVRRDGSAVEFRGDFCRSADVVAESGSGNLVQFCWVLQG